MHRTMKKKKGFRNDRGIVTTYLIDIKRIIKEFYEQLRLHIFDNSDEMDQFLEKHKPPKLTQGDTDNRNCCISAEETESMINYLSKKGKYQFHTILLVNSTKHLRKDTNSPVFYTCTHTHTQTTFTLLNY